VGSESTVERTFDRTLLIRHLAICVAGVVAYALRSELQIGYTALAIVGVGAVLNFLAFAFRTRPELSRACWIASPVIGVGSWAALIAVTKGVESPFIAGLWLEVVLSAMALSRAGVILVTFGAVVALWAQELWFGTHGVGVSLLLQSGFLLGMGGATFLVTRRWARTQRDLTQKYTVLGTRLAAMARQLEDERTLCELGENAGRLAHGIKNAVHSLSGFVGLIEPKLPAGRGSHAALAGLRTAIEDLERLARLTLGDRSEEKAEVHREAASCPASYVERAVREIALSHPDVHWQTTSDGTSPTLPIPRAELREVLLIVLRNAVEAMDGHGEASIETRSTGSEFHVVVRDGGVGLPPGAVPRIFEAGFTTKPEGSGYGLFLARRILEKHHGHLDAKPARPTGAAFDLALPVLQAEGDLLAVHGLR
jgi:signal transduction histidine kinase